MSLNTLIFECMQRTQNRLIPLPFLLWAVFFALNSKALAATPTVRVSIEASNPMANPVLKLDSPADNPYTSQKSLDTRKRAIFLLNLTFRVLAEATEPTNFSTKLDCESDEGNGVTAYVRALPYPHWKSLFPEGPVDCKKGLLGAVFDSSATSHAAFEIVVLVGLKSEIERTEFSKNERPEFSDFIRTGFMVNSGNGEYFGMLAGEGIGTESKLFTSRNSTCKLEASPLEGYPVSLKDIWLRPLTPFWGGGLDVSISPGEGNDTCRLYPNGDFEIRRNSQINAFRYAKQGALSHMYRTTDMQDRVILLDPILGGDADHNGKVDLKDLGYLKQAFGKATSISPDFITDLNGDGATNIKDLGVVKMNFNQASEKTTCLDGWDFTVGDNPQFPIPEAETCP